MAEVDFLLEELSLPSGSILDIGCGTGPLFLPQLLIGFRFCAFSKLVNNEPEKSSERSNQKTKNNKQY